MAPQSDSLLVGPDALAASASNGGFARLPSELACLWAAVSYAWAGFYGRRFRSVAPIKIATGQISGAALVMAPLSLGFDHPWTRDPRASGCGRPWRGSR